MPEIKQTKQYSHDVKKVLWIILVLNLFVLIVKIFAGLITRSLSIFGDAAHTGADTLNNIVGLVVLKYASEPPDKQHPYGHGKFETLAAFAIVMFLAIASVEIVQSSIGRLIHPVKLPLFSKEVVWLLILTLIVNLFVWVYERNQGKKIKSDLLIADSSHTGSDVLITFSVLASQFFIAREMYWIDPIVAILIAGFIAKAAYEIITSTVPVLVDEAWLEPKMISGSALSVKDVVDCYDVYSRRSPYSAFIECKIKVVPKDLYSAHKIADRVEEKLRKDFGNCKVTVHVEP
ncbi:MAG: cation transporter [Candidatus Melainabacteria bacterium]|nr:cation transporter [Candidatus Melainabacteria bacterium]